MLRHVALALLALLPLAASSPVEPSTQLSLTQWTRACFSELPCFDGARAHGGLHLNDYRYSVRYPSPKPFVKFEEFRHRLVEFGRVMAAQLQAPGVWFDDPNGEVAASVTATGVADLEHSSDTVPFPYVQKLLLPADAVVAVFGDFHGSLHSLLRELNALADRGYLQDDFGVTPAWQGRFFMLFLGDYVDRGLFGACHPGSPRFIRLV